MVFRQNQCESVTLCILFLTLLHFKAFGFLTFLFPKYLYKEKLEVTNCTVYHKLMCCEVRHGGSVTRPPCRCQLYKCCPWSQACSPFMRVGVWWTAVPCVPTQLLLQGPHLRLPEDLRISDSCQQEEKDLSGPRWSILYEENAQEKDHLTAGETSLRASLPQAWSPAWPTSLCVYAHV